MKALRILYISISIMLVIFQAMPVGADGLDGAATDIEARINAFRAEPYKNISEFADSNGMDRSLLPVWVESLKDSSLPMLRSNFLVAKAAENHASDLIDRN